MCLGHAKTPSLLRQITLLKNTVDYSSVFFPTSPPRPPRKTIAGSGINCKFVVQVTGGYARPRDLRYFRLFLSPILDAFIWTDFKDRPSWSAISRVLLFEYSFLSALTSSFDHKPLTDLFFFAITRLLCVWLCPAFAICSVYYNQYQRGKQALFFVTIEKNNRRANT